MATDLEVLRIKLELAETERDRLRAVVDAARAHVEAEDYPGEVETFDRLVTALAQLDVSPDTGA